MSRIVRRVNYSRRNFVQALSAGLFVSAIDVSSFAFNARLSAAERMARSSSLSVERLPPGVEVHQVTSAPFEQSNIYCEDCYCSADSRYFVYERKNFALTSNRTELITVEMGTWKQHRLDVGADIGEGSDIWGPAISRRGVFYYWKHRRNALDLVRADLAVGQPQTVYSRPAARPILSLGTVSADDRYFAGGIRLNDRWESFGILLIDLQKGAESIIDRDRYLLSPHPHFDPGQGSRLLIQHNRGGRFTPDGTIQRLVGPEGATIYLLGLDGTRTPLRVGTPYTTPCTGHETWIGTTGEVLFTVEPSNGFAAEKGNLLAVRPRTSARVVAHGYRFNHVGMSVCGKFFSADHSASGYPIVIGSMRTGKAGVLCVSQTQMGNRYHTHTHPYMTPDLKWVIFNSNRSGQTHIYAARVPEQWLSQLEG